MGVDYTILYKNYYRILVKYATAIVNRREDAENISQDVFLMLLEHPEVLSCVSNIKSYMKVLTRNRCYDYIRHMECERIYAEKIMAQGLNVKVLYGECPEIYENLSYEETRAIIRRSIMMLPARCREVFLLHRKEGLKYREISARLGISENTVENHIGIAIKRIKTEYLSEVS